MVLGYHVLLGMFGFWLHNDPRRSWSDFVRSWERYRSDEQATKTDERRSVAHTTPNTLVGACGLTLASPHWAACPKHHAPPGSLSHGFPLTWRAAGWYNTSSWG